jgi:hypothetical protein
MGELVEKLVKGKIIILLFIDIILINLSYIFAFYFVFIYRIPQEYIIKEEVSSLGFRVSSSLAGKQSVNRTNPQLATSNSKLESS